MRIDAPTAADVRFVASRMRERDREEFLALSPYEHHDEMVEAMVWRYGDGRDTFGAFLGSEPVAVGAMVEHRPGVVTLMFCATDRFPEIVIGLTGFIRRRLFPAYVAHGTHRIECVALDGYVEVDRWLQILGLKQEAVMPGYGRGGETFRQYAWVKDAGQVGDAGRLRRDRRDGPGERDEHPADAYLQRRPSPGNAPEVS